MVPLCPYAAGRASLNLAIRAYPPIPARPILTAHCVGVRSSSTPSKATPTGRSARAPSGSHARLGQPKVEDKRRPQIQVRRNKIQIGRDAIQARRNKIQIRRKKIQEKIQAFPTADRDFPMGYATRGGGPTARPSPGRRNSRTIAQISDYHKRLLGRSGSRAARRRRLKASPAARLQ
jgi:hypothetical protein